MNITLENIHTFPRAEKAMDLHKAGYNCAQAVFLAFADCFGMDANLAAHLSGPFGGGVGGQREVCGAVSGMTMALGMLYGYSDPADKNAKIALYERVQKCSAAFRTVAGSIVCRELLGLDKNAPQPAPGERPKPGKIPCRTLVGLAAAVLEQHMTETE